MQNLDQISFKSIQYSKDLTSEIMEIGIIFQDIFKEKNGLVEEIKFQNICKIFQKIKMKRNHISQELSKNKFNQKNQQNFEFYQNFQKQEQLFQNLNKEFLNIYAINEYQGMDQNKENLQKNNNLANGNNSKRAQYMNSKFKKINYELQDQGGILDEMTKMSYESESFLTLIGINLNRDRQIINDSEKFNEQINDEVQKAQIIISFMNRRIIVDRMILWSIVIILFIINLLVLYMKL